MTSRKKRRREPVLTGDPVPAARKKKPTFKLGIVTPFHRQYEVGLKYLEWIGVLNRKLRDVTFVKVAVVSGDWPLAKLEGWNVVTHPNEPLGDKFNAGFAALQDKGVDAAMVLGMDDFVSPSYIKECIDTAKLGVDYMGPSGCHFVDFKSQDSVYIDATNTVGAGRFFTARLLDKLDWQPYPEGQNDSLDHVMRNKVLEKASHEHAITMDPLISEHTIVDVKTGDNRNPWSRIRGVRGARAADDLGARKPDLWTLLFGTVAETV